MKKTRRNIGRAYVCPELEVIVFYSALLASRDLCTIKQSILLLTLLFISVLFRILAL